MTLFLNALAVLTAAAVAVGLFFFATTRGALLVRKATGRAGDAAAHVYPIYSNMGLIRLVDYQPIISAILLFQYPHLVSKIVEGLRGADLRGKRVLVTSCAFGNVMPRCVSAAFASGAQVVEVADIVANELTHAAAKLGTEFPEYRDRIEYIRSDAVSLDVPDASVDANIMFFLLHELPHDLKIRALREASRVLAPGGTLYVGEFHRPRAWLLRAMSWTYFKVFEPYGHALWTTHDPVALLKAVGEWRIERKTFFFDNYQMITATKL